jgi:ribose-phosphate pyrophosphokinase
MNDAPGPLVFALPGNDALAQRLTTGIKGELGATAVRRFPDGETYLRLDTVPRDRDVIIAGTLDRPDGKFLTLAFLAATARELGATSVGLVAPYLSYLRQDRRFHDGEALTSQFFARLVSGTVDWLITVDPHLHRYASLAELYSIPTTVVHAAPLLGQWVRAHVPDPVIIGPDAESTQWASAVAAEANAPVIVLEKTRRGDSDVAVSVPDAARYRDRTPVLIDDIISTGQTMRATVRHLREGGFVRATCVAVHAVFADDAYVALREAGAAPIVTCNTIPHASNVIDIVPSLVDAISSGLPTHVATS